MRECGQCGKTFDDDARFCGECGRSLSDAPPQPAAKFCAACGTTRTASDRFCGGCGRSFAAGPAPVDPRPAVSAPVAAPVTAPVRAMPPPTPGPRRGGAIKVLAVLAVLLLFFAGGAAGIWWWKPWRIIWPAPEYAIDRAAWDREMVPPVDKQADEARKASWSAAVHQRAAEAEAAFLARDVEAILRVLPPPQREEMRPLLESKRDELDRFGKVLATRKLVAVYEFIADFQVRDGKKAYPVTFALYDGQWYLNEF